MTLFSPQTFRRLSGGLFLSANIALMVTNIVDMNAMQFLAGILLMTCSMALILSSWHHRWLFYGGACLIVSYILIGLSAPVDGIILQEIGSLSGVLGGILTLRAAFQRETGKQYNLKFPFNLADTYPLASAGILEGSFCTLLITGAFLNGDYNLGTIACLWLVAYFCLMGSDEIFRKRIGF